MVRAPSAICSLRWRPTFRRTKTRCGTANVTGEQPVRPALCRAEDDDAETVGQPVVKQRLAFWLLLQIVPDGVWAHDKDALFLWARPALAGAGFGTASDTAPFFSLTAGDRALPSPPSRLPIPWQMKCRGSV